MLWIKNVNENKPFYATLESVGFDIFSTETKTLDARGGFAIFGTGLFIDPLQDFRKTKPIVLGNNGSLLASECLETYDLLPELQIRSRSGLAAKNQVVVLNSPGTIEADYPDEIKVMLMNHGPVPFEVQAGARIAQGVVALTVRAHNVEVKQVTRTGGLGSTGAK